MVLRSKMPFINDPEGAQVPAGMPPIIDAHVHWVYCAYILMNSSPPGFPDVMKSMAEKQLMVNKIIEKKELSAVNQLLTQAKEPQRLKSLIQKALNGGSIVGTPVLCGFAGI